MWSVLACRVGRFGHSVVYFDVSVILITTKLEEMVTLTPWVFDRASFTVTTHNTF